jgi:uncharacterized surface protein with fasciclin (FAS1) repeats
VAGLVIATGLAVLAPRPVSAQPAARDIVDTAVAAGSFKTLATALQAAGLVETLKGPGPYTVFAPTDDAFAKLPAGTVEALLKDQAKLKSVLLYHVVPGRVVAADVVKMPSATSAQGAALRIDATSGVKINSATVTQPDVMASNGVIHVIDTVLLPPEAAPAVAAAQAPQALPRAGEAGANELLLVAMLAAVGLLGGGLWWRSGVTRWR